MSSRKQNSNNVNDNDDYVGNNDDEKNNNDNNEKKQQHLLAHLSKIRVQELETSNNNNNPNTNNNSINRTVIYETPKSKSIGASILGDGSSNESTLFLAHHHNKNKYSEADSIIISGGRGPSLKRSRLMKNLSELSSLNLDKKHQKNNSSNNNNDPRHHNKDGRSNVKSETSSITGNPSLSTIGVTGRRRKTRMMIHQQINNNSTNDDDNNNNNLANNQIQEEEYTGDDSIVIGENSSSSKSKSIFGGKLIHATNTFNDTHNGSGSKKTNSSKIPLVSTDNNHNHDDENQDHDDVEQQMIAPNHKDNNNINNNNNNSLLTTDDYDDLKKRQQQQQKTTAVPIVVSRAVYEEKILGIRGNHHIRTNATTTNTNNNESSNRSVTSTNNVNNNNNINNNNGVGDDDNNTHQNRKKLGSSAYPSSGYHANASSTAFNGSNNASFSNLVDNNSCRNNGHNNHNVSSSAGAFTRLSSLRVIRSVAKKLQSVVVQRRKVEPSETNNKNGANNECNHSHRHHYRHHHFQKDNNNTAQSAPTSPVHRPASVGGVQLPAAIVNNSNNNNSMMSNNNNGSFFVMNSAVGFLNASSSASSGEAITSHHHQHSMILQELFEESKRGNIPSSTPTRLITDNDNTIDRSCGVCAGGDLSSGDIQNNRSRTTKVIDLKLELLPIVSRGCSSRSPRLREASSSTPRARNNSNNNNNDDDEQQSSSRGTTHPHPHRTSEPLLITDDPPPGNDHHSNDSPSTTSNNNSKDNIAEKYSSSSKLDGERFHSVTIRDATKQVKNDDNNNKSASSRAVVFSDDTAGDRTRETMESSPDHHHSSVILARAKGMRTVLLRNNNNKNTASSSSGVTNNNNNNNSSGISNNNNCTNKKGSTSSIRDTSSNYPLSDGPFSPLLKLRPLSLKSDAEDDGEDEQTRKSSPTPTSTQFIRSPSMGSSTALTNAETRSLRDPVLQYIASFGSESLITSFLESSPSAFDRWSEVYSSLKYPGTFEPIKALGQGSFGMAVLVAYKKPNSTVDSSNNNNNASSSPSNIGTGRNRSPSPAASTNNNNASSAAKTRSNCFGTKSSERITAEDTHRQQLREEKNKDITPNGSGYACSAMGCSDAIVVVPITNNSGMTVGLTKYKREDVFVCKMETIPETLAEQAAAAAKQQRQEQQQQGDSVDSFSDPVSPLPNNAKPPIISSNERQRQLLVNDYAQQRLERMQHEAHILSNLAHPNIVGFIDYHVEPSKQCHYLYIEYVDGGDLSSVLQTQRTMQHRVPPLSEEKLLDTFAQVVLAVEYLHRHNILHRDIKSQNVLLSKKHRFVKLTDFGTAREFDTDTTATVDNALKGSPLYLSPELCGSSSSADGSSSAANFYSEKTDMWSLGVLLFELFTNGSAFPFWNRSMDRLRDDIRHKHMAAPPRVHRDGNIVSSSAYRLVLALLHKDPRKRPTAKQVLTQFSCMRTALDRYVVRFHRDLVEPIPEAEREASADFKLFSIIKEHVALVRDKINLDEIVAGTSAAAASLLTSRTGVSQYNSRRLIPVNTTNQSGNYNNAITNSIINNGPTTTNNNNNTSNINSSSIVLSGVPRLFSRVTQSADDGGHSTNLLIRRNSHTSHDALLQSEDLRSTPERSNNNNNLNNNNNTPSHQQHLNNTPTAIAASASLPSQQSHRQYRAALLDYARDRELEEAAKLLASRDGSESGRSGGASRGNRLE